MHIHISAMEALKAFFLILLVGIPWRIIASKLASSENSFASNLGQAMAFGY